MAERPKHEQKLSQSAIVQNAPRLDRAVHSLSDAESTSSDDDGDDDDDDEFVLARTDGAASTEAVADVSFC